MSLVKHHELWVQQGSVIAPTLFLVMINDVVKAANNSNKCMLYADDLSIISDNFLASTQAKQLELHQKAINRANEILTEAGLELASEKTTFIVFSRKKTRRVDFDDYHIKLNGKRIDPVSLVKFLGVTITKTVSWAKHIDNLIAKAKRSINLIKILAGTPWLKGSKVLIDVAVALVRSRLTYGQEAYFGASKYQLAKLEAVDRTALRIALGVNSSAKNELVYAEAGQPPLSEYRKVATA